MTKLIRNIFFWYMLVGMIGFVLAERKIQPTPSIWDVCAMANGFLVGYCLARITERRKA